MKNEKTALVFEDTTLSKITTDILLKQKNPGDLIALLVFYYQTAKWQKAIHGISTHYTVIKCTNTYAKNGLHWNKNKLVKIKKQLTDLGMIESIKKTENGKITGHFIKIIFMYEQKPQLQENLPEDYIEYSGIIEQIPTILNENGDYEEIFQSTQNPPSGFRVHKYYITNNSNTGQLLTKKNTSNITLNDPADTKNNELKNSLLKFNLTEKLNSNEIREIERLVNNNRYSYPQAIGIVISDRKNISSPNPPENEVDPVKNIKEPLKETVQDSSIPPMPADWSIGLCEEFRVKSWIQQVETDRKVNQHKMTGYKTDLLNNICNTDLVKESKYIYN